MLGPLLIEMGTEDQKERYLPPILRGEVRWCQSYSEPGVGSDLASLQTRALDQGDYYEINGTKIWTSNAYMSDWMFCLVRTNSQARKHEGINFVLLNMREIGLSVNQIELINAERGVAKSFLTVSGPIKLIWSGLKMRAGPSLSDCCSLSVQPLVGEVLFPDRCLCQTCWLDTHLWMSQHEHAFWA